MLDHCCEGKCVLKNLRRAKYVKSYGDDLCGRHEPYVSLIWPAGLKKLHFRDKGRKAFWLLSLSQLGKSVDTKI